MYFQFKLDKNQGSSEVQTNHSADNLPHQCSQEIIQMTCSVDNGSPFAENTIDELEKDLAKLGMQLHCDFRGYFE